MALCERDRSGCRCQNRQREGRATGADGGRRKAEMPCPAMPETRDRGMLSSQFRSLAYANGMDGDTRGTQATAVERVIAILLEDQEHRLPEALPVTMPPKSALSK
jgi:hypothetical protein